MKTAQWMKNHTEDLAGKVVALTGAAGGLGSRLSRALVQLHAKLIMIDRDLGPMQTLRDEILQTNPDAEIEIIKLDLYRIEDVRGVAAQLSQQNIDFLMLNAGVYNVPLTVGALGYNNVFQINFISQYYLVKCLMPTLARCHGKVIMTSSIAHTYATLDENDLDYTKHAKGTQVYGNSKRWLMFALGELIKQQTDVKLAIVHPGVTPTPMTATNWFIKVTMKMLFPSPDVAVLNILWGVFKDLGPDEWIGPKRKNIWGAPTVQKIKAGTPSERTRIYELAESICQTIEQKI